MNVASGDDQPRPASAGAAERAGRTRSASGELAAGVERLRLKFPGAPALTFRDLSFTVRAGENVLLLGPSGCGKSTLLQVLTGLIPHAVDVPVKADRITVPERWAFVFQDPDTQFCMPFVDEELAFVLENLRVPREEMKPRMERLLAQVGLKLERLHTPISALSQGMKQRLAIACALALEPDVLFLDEPTALLDPQGTKQVWETIRTVSAGKTVVVVEHKIDEIVDAIDRIVLFGRSGEIVADGPPDAVFAAHRGRFAEDGIWYPGVWDDMIGRRRHARTATLAEGGRTAESAEPARVDVADGAESDAVEGPPESAGGGPETGPVLIELDRFVAFRGKEAKLTVRTASVRAGEWIAVVGENGAGKSTLLLGLMRLVRTAGGYSLRGRDIAGYRDLSNEIAFVFQNPEFQFVTNSVYEEIAFALRRDNMPEAVIDAKVRELLAAFDLEDRKDQHPFQLSLGQKRRLSVASAIVKEQPVLLLDEPTFGQDAKNTFALLEKLEAWRRRGTAIVMVTHDTEIVRRFATRVWHIENGELRADMPPDEWQAGGGLPVREARTDAPSGGRREGIASPCRLLEGRGNASADDRAAAGSTAAESGPIQPGPGAGTRTSAASAGSGASVPVGGAGGKEPVSCS